MLLALTTATEACGVALWRDGAVEAELTLKRPRRHAERLVPLVRDALGHAGAAPDALDAVALAAGPGSYTGLRIGASTAKGLASATGAALVAVPTLEALAEAARPFAPGGALLFATLASRRGEVYAAAYRPDGDADTLTPVFEAEALTSEEATKRLHAAAEDATDAERPAWLLGPGAARVAEAFATGAEPPFRLVERVFPTAGAVARLGARHFRAGTVADAAAFEPHYLKAFHPAPRRQSAFEPLS